VTLALREWQANFAAQLAGGGGEVRLAIHRHHIRRSLAKALAATFPTVQALVGPDFFRQTAESFVAQNLPTQPVLAEYGAAFPDFLAAQETLHGLAYLADVARLDWALNAAFYSPRGPRLSVADLAGMPAEQLSAMVLTLAPGTALVRSGYPLDRIWAASQPDAPDEKVDITQEPVRLLILRRPEDAGFIALGEGEAAFVAAVAEGRSLEIAARAGFTVARSFDLSPCFARLLGCEAFAAMQQ
jgi:hypothetical protein